jgi:hypothetical protein
MKTMGQLRRSGGGAAVLLLIALAAGCDSGTPAVEGSLEEATVKGTVKVRGKPLDGGEVVFNPSNPKRIVPARVAPIGKDGSYTVKALVGLNVVTAMPPKAKNKTQGRATFGLEYDEKSVTVNSGENTVDLDFLK